MKDIVLRTDSHHKQRKVSWLELFFDLVFVVIIARIAHDFLSDISWSGFRTFIFMFLSVWWMWSSVIYFTERFASTEQIQRIYIFFDDDPRCWHDDIYASWFRGKLSWLCDFLLDFASYLFWHDLIRYAEDKRI